MGDEIVALSREYELKQETEWGRSFQGVALAALGRTTEGIDQLKDSLAVQQAIGSGLVRTAFLALLGEMLGERRTDRRRAAGGRRRLRARGEDARGRIPRRAAPGPWRTAAPSRATTPPPRRACACAIARAIAQQAKSFELRAATDLARLLLAAGRRDDARAVLAPVFEWFTEGHSTTRTSSPRERPLPRSARDGKRNTTTADRARARRGVRVPARDTGRSRPPAEAVAAARRRRSCGGTPAPATPRSASRAAACAAAASASACCRGWRGPACSDKFDYLSTVSGGGYIGGWLTAWRLHAHERQRGRSVLNSSDEISSPTRSRACARVIKFLDPRTGLLSADVWTLGGTMFRNLLVNWMVLDAAHRHSGDAAQNLSRPPRPAVAARAREPGHARLVVPPRLDSHRLS